MNNGTVSWFNEHNGYGVIETENKKRIIVRNSGIRFPSVKKYLSEGDRVKFKLIKGAGCSFAVDVSVI